MTIPTTIAASGPYYPNGATTVFPFGFKASADTDVIVVLISSAGVETIVPSSSYAVTLAAGDDPGGSVTFTSAPANDGRELWIYLDPTFLQEIKFEDEGAFNQTLLNQLADEAGSRSVWLRERINRAFLLPRAGAALTAVVGQFPVVLPGGVAGFASGTGTDGALRADLGSTVALKGAALIGNYGGGTVQDAIFVKGRAAPIAGSKAQINWVRDDATDPMENIGGLWVGGVRVDHGFNKVWTAANASGTNAPVATMFVKAKNTGTDLDVVGFMAFAEVAATGKTVFGANIGVWSSGGAQNYKLVGLEIDIQPQAGTTPSTVGGLYINVFTMSVPGPAIYIEGIFGGKWGTGLSIGNLSDTGSGIGPAAGNPRMGTLLDSGVAQYQIAAIKLNNLHKFMIFGTAGNVATAAMLWVDGGNFLHAVLPAAGWVFRDNGDTTSLITIDNGGSLNLEAGGVIKVSSTQVLSSRKTGWVAATGTATRSTFATGSVTLPVLAEHVKALIDDFISHGALGA